MEDMDVGNGDTDFDADDTAGWFLISGVLDGGVGGGVVSLITGS